MAKAKFKGIRMNYETTPALPSKVEVVLSSGAATVVAAARECSPAVPFVMHETLVKALVTAANSGQYSDENSAAMYRVAELLAGR